jgi:hypothetical protein
MKYSKSNSEYFRNKKGGGLETNGKLNSSNFNRNAKLVELEETNSSNNTSKIKPIKIMVKKKSKIKGFFGKLFSDEHYIFFGYNPETRIYEYVCYVNPDFAGYKLNAGLPIICKKREDNGTIIDVTHEQFLNINIKELSILIYNLLIIPRNSLSLDQTFFRYLLDFVLPDILKKYKRANNENLHDIVGKIKEILRIPNKSNNSNNATLPPRRNK